MNLSQSRVRMRKNGSIASVIPRRVHRGCQVGHARGGLGSGVAEWSLLSGCDTKPKRNFHDLPAAGRSLSRQQNTQSEAVWDGYRAIRGRQGNCGVASHVDWTRQRGVMYVESFECPQLNLNFLGWS